jgi:hypothetical protein
MWMVSTYLQLATGHEHNQKSVSCQQTIHPTLVGATSL